MAGSAAEKEWDEIMAGVNGLYESLEDVDWVDLNLAACQLDEEIKAFFSTNDFKDNRVLVQRVLADGERIQEVFSAILGAAANSRKVYLAEATSLSKGSRGVQAYKKV